MTTSRRGFLVGAGAAAAWPLGACVQRSDDDTTVDERSEKTRNNPLDGLEREPITISDVKVTLLSHELPAEEQWYLDWIPERYKCWKSDSILVEVFTKAY